MKKGVLEIEPGAKLVSQATDNTEVTFTKRRGRSLKSFVAAGRSASAEKRRVSGSCKVRGSLRSGL